MTDGNPTNDPTPATEAPDPDWRRKPALGSDLILVLGLLAAAAFGALILSDNPDVSRTFPENTWLALGFLAALQFVRFYFWKRLAALVAVGIGRSAAVGLIAYSAIASFVPFYRGREDLAFYTGLAVLAIGFTHQHARLLKDPRILARWTALAIAVSGLVLVYLAGNAALDAGTLGLLPPALKYAGAAIFASYALRVLLQHLSAHVVEPKGGGWMAGFLAHAPAIMVVGAIVGSYLAFREDVNAAIPFLPLWEFGLGIALMSALIARGRNRLKATLTEAPIASRARTHRVRVDAYPDAAFRDVARVLGDYLASGRGRRAYRDTLQKVAGWDAALAEEAFADFDAYRDRRDALPLPLGFGLVSAVLLFTGLGAAVAIVLSALELVAGSPAPVIPDPAVSAGVLVGTGGLLAAALESARARRPVPFGIMGAIGSVAAGVVLAAVFMNLGVWNVAPPWSIFVLVGLTAASAIAFVASAMRMARTRERAIELEDWETHMTRVNAEGFQVHLYAMVGVLIALLLAWWPADLVLADLAARELIDRTVHDAFRASLLPSTVAAVGVAVSSGVKILGYVVGRARVEEQEALNRMARVDMHDALVSRMELSAAVRPFAAHVAGGRSRDPESGGPATAAPGPTGAGTSGT